MNYQDIDPFEEYFPGNSLKSRCKRKLRRFFSIDVNGSRARHNLKSRTVIKAETLRHLLFYGGKIHCFSQFRLCWELLMIVTYGLAFTVIPYQVAFRYGQRNDNSTLLKIKRAVDVICLMDIAINFLSSYQDQRTGNIVLKGSKIIWRYVRGYFWIDFLSTIPDMVLWMWFSINGRDNTHPCQNVIECHQDKIAMLSLLKILQMPLFFKYLLDYPKRHNKSEYSIKVMRNLLTIPFVFHFIVCLNFLWLSFFFVPDVENIMPLNSPVTFNFWQKTSEAEKYGIVVFAVTHTLGLFANEVQEKVIPDILFGICLTLVGFMLHIWFISQMYSKVRTSQGPILRFQEIRHQIEKYIAFKHLPKKTQKRILDYYDYCYKDKFIRKEEINALLDNDLRHFIAKETIENLLIQHYIFLELPANLLHSIAVAMTENVFLPNDVICHSHRRKGQKLFLIIYGTVAVYNSDGEEIVHLSDGNLFGEVDFFLQHGKQSSTNYYVAVEKSVISALNRKDFMRIMADNNEMIEKIRSTLRTTESEAVIERENIVKFNI